VAGHLCLDIIPQFRLGENRSIKDLFVPGKLINIEEASISSGGAVSNTGIALARLGIKTALMGKVGADPFGKLLEGLVLSKGAESKIIISEADSTSYTIVLAVPGYDRFLLHNTGANDTFCADDPDYAMIQDVKLFHFGYPPLMKRMYENDGAELTALFKRIKGMGVTTSLDMSLPDAASPAGMADWRAILEKVLPYVDIFIPSVEEIMYMINRDAYTALNSGDSGADLLDRLSIDKLPAIGEQLIGMGAAIAALKCGKKGIYIKTASESRFAEMGRARPAVMHCWADREMHCESYFVHPVLSTAGSGDNCIAGFLAAFLHGMSIEECIGIGCVVGAQNVRVLDSVSGVKDWDETLCQYRSGMERNTLRECSLMWIYDAKTGTRYRR